jgi:YjbE family integral membrane protein
MDMMLTTVFWVGLMKIIWIDLLLSGDNAVVIALAARSLPPRQQRQAILWGTGAAIGLRVVLTMFAIALLTLPYLKLAGALMLLWIGIKLLVPDEGGDDVGASDNLWSAVRTIVIADFVMSLDNVIGVAAVAETAGGDAKLVLLVLGLAISIPIMIFGSRLVLKWMERFPWIITLGAGLLGWIAGELMIGDPAVKDWVEANAGWLHEWRIAAMLGALLVVIVGTSLARRHPMRPAEHDVK